MAKETSTTVERATPNGKHVNSRNLEWPQDTYGITTLLRKEGTRAVGRIGGDEEKLNVVLNSLRVLGEHAKAKFSDQQVERERALAAQENIRQAEYARSEADKKREVSRLEGLLAAAKAALAAKEATTEAA